MRCESCIKLLKILPQTQVNNIPRACGLQSNVFSLFSIMDQEEFCISSLTFDTTGIFFNSAFLCVVIELVVKASEKDEITMKATVPTSLDKYSVSWLYVRYLYHGDNPACIDLLTSSISYIEYYVGAFSVQFRMKTARHFHR